MRMQRKSLCLFYTKGTSLELIIILDDEDYFLSSYPKHHYLRIKYLTNR